MRNNTPSSLPSRWLVQGVLVGIFCALAACGGHGGSSAGNPPVSPPPPPPPPPPSNPPPPSFGAPSLAPTLATGRANSATFGPTGGTLAATAADGTRFELTIPPSALGVATDVTLTPVDSIANLPFDDGLLAAVNFEPSGLVFAVPARLTIELPSAAPARTAAFNWEGAANTFGVTAPVIAADRLSATVLVEHFSGYGLGIPGPSQLAELSNELLLLTVDEANAGAFAMLFCDDCTLSEQIEFAEDWFDLIVRLRLEEGPNGPVPTLVGTAAFLSWHYFVNEWLASFPELQSRLDLGATMDLANLLGQHQAYTYPQCSGAVADWKDWLRIPDELRIRVEQRYPAELSSFPALYSGYGGDRNVCAYLTSTFVNPPATVGDQQSELTLTLRTQIVHPGGTLPIAANVEVHYSDGADGDSDLLTDETSGEVSLLVERDLAFPAFRVGVRSLEPTLGRDEVLNFYDEIGYGNAGLRFISFLGPQPILGLGAHEELLAVFEPEGEQPVGATVNFSLEGPGSLSATSAATELYAGSNVARVEYIAPDSPVLPNFTANITATASYNGQDYQAIQVLHPYWVALSLLVDNGNALVDGTDSTVQVLGNGPFELRARALGAGQTTVSPPVPVDLPNDSVTFEAVNPVEQTLRPVGGLCCDTSTVVQVDANGDAAAEWVSDFAIDQAEHYVEARYDDGSGAGLVATGVTLQRGNAASIYSSINVPLQPLVTTPVIFSAAFNDTGLPASAHWLEFGNAIGATLGAAGGLLDDLGRLDTTIQPAGGIFCVSYEATLRPDPGGEELGHQRFLHVLEPLGNVGIASQPFSMLVRNDDLGATGDFLPVSSRSCLVPGEATQTRTQTAELTVTGPNNATCQGGTYTGRIEQIATLSVSPDGSQYTLDVDGGNEEEGTPACGPLSFFNRHRSTLTLPEDSTATASFTFLPSVVTGNLSHGATVWLLRETPEEAAINSNGVRTEQTIACLIGSGVNGIGPCTLSSGSIPPTSFSGSLDPGLIYRVMTQTQGIGGYGYHVEVNVTQPPP